MRQCFFKTTLVVVFAMVSMCAMAQRVVNGVELSNKEVAQYLVKNSKDSVLMAESVKINKTDTIVVKRIAFVLSDGRLAAKSDTIVYRPTVKVIAAVSPVKKDSLYKASVKTRFVEKLYDDKKRDTYYAYCDSVPGVSYSDPNAGKIVLRGADKYGWGVNLYAGYQMAEHVNSPVAGAGLEYTRSWWGAYLNGEAGYSKYTHNAVKAGEKYWSFRAESALMLQPFKFDSFNQNRLFFFGGIGFESYETDSKTYVDEEGKASDFRSWGNYMYPTAGLKFEHRIFSTGNSLYLTAQWRGLEGIIQNSGSEKYNAFMMTVGFNFGIFRNKVANMSLKEVRALTK